MTADRARTADAEPTAADLERLTSCPAKRAEYANDLYFRESWPDVASIFGGAAMAMLESVVLVSFKPDAVVGRRMRATLDYAVAHGFRPLAAAPLAYTRHSMRELWRYDWHIYPVDRLRFSTLWYTCADVAALAFRDVRPQVGVSGAARLAALKGAAVASQRKPDQLRSLLRPPNQILNFVHVADEPADVVRELGIFFDRPARRSMLAAIVTHFDADRYDVAVAAIAALEARYAEHDLAFEPSLARLVRAGAVSTANAARLLRAFRGAERWGWDELCARIDASAPKADRWDIVAVASYLVPLERDVAAHGLAGGR